MLSVSKVLVVVFCLIVTVYSQETNNPDFVKPCYKNRPEDPLNACLARTFEDIRPFLKSGIPKYNTPIIDPLKINTVVFENNGRIQIQAGFKHLQVNKSSEYKVTKLKADLDALTIDVGLSWDKLIATGEYNIRGQVLILNIESKGKFAVLLENVDSLSRIKAKIVKNKDGDDVLQVTDAQVAYTVGKSKFRIRQYPSNALEKIVNDYLNTNGDEVIRETRAETAKTIVYHMKIILNQIFEKIPLKLWVADALE